MKIKVQKSERQTFSFSWPLWRSISRILACSSSICFSASGSYVPLATANIFLKFIIFKHKMHKKVKSVPWFVQQQNLIQKNDTKNGLVLYEFFSTNTAISDDGKYSWHVCKVAVLLSLVVTACIQCNSRLTYFLIHAKRSYHIISYHIILPSLIRSDS